MGVRASSLTGGRACDTRQRCCGLANVGLGGEAKLTLRTFDRERPVVDKEARPPSMQWRFDPKRPAQRLANHSGPSGRPVRQVLLRRWDSEGRRNCFDQFIQGEPALAGQDVGSPDGSRMLATQQDALDQVVDVNQMVEGFARAEHAETALGYGLEELQETEVTRAVHPGRPEDHAGKAALEGGLRLEFGLELGFLVDVAWVEGAFLGARNLLHIPMYTDGRAVQGSLHLVCLRCRQHILGATDIHLTVVAVGMTRRPVGTGTGDVVGSLNPGRRPQNIFAPAEIALHEVHAGRHKCIGLCSRPHQRAHRMAKLPEATGQMTASKAGGAGDQNRYGVCDRGTDARLLLRWHAGVGSCRLG